MVNIKNENTYNVGDKVWWFDAWDNLKNGVIYEIGEENMRGEKTPVARIHENGREGSQTGAKLADCWPSREACLNAEAERSRLQTETYKESIKDVADLVRFMYNHDIHSEFRDYDAEAVVVERTKELLGIDLTQQQDAELAETEDFATAINNMDLGDGGRSI